METQDPTIEANGQGGAPSANEFAIGVIAPEPMAQSGDEIKAIADKIPSAEDIASEAGLYLKQQKKLEGLQEVVKTTIVESKSGEVSATEEKTRNEARLTEIDRQVAELSGGISSLKQESKKLGGEITQHTHASAWAEDRLGKLDDEVDGAIKKIDDALEKNKQSIDVKAFEDMNAIDDEYNDQVNELVRLWGEEVKDMEAGIEMVGKVTSDSEGHLSASRPGNMNRVGENVGGSGIKDVMQTAWGGEVAADLTKGEFDKIQQEISGRKQVVLDEAEAKKSDLEETAKEQRASEEKLGGEKITAWREAITNASSEIGELSKKQEGVNAELSTKEEQLEALQLEREEIVGKVEGLGGQIELYREAIKTNEEWLSRVMEKMEMIFEKGVGAVESLVQTEKTVNGAIENVKAQAELLIFRVDKAVSERMKEAKDTLDAATKAADEGFERQIIALETPLLMDKSLGFGVDPEGRLLTTPSRYLENKRQRRALEKLDPYADKIEADRDSEITTARNEFSDRREEVVGAASAERAKIEEARLAAVSRLSQAAETAKLVRETAVEVFGTGPIAPEMVTRRTNFLTKGLDLARRILVGQ